MKDKDSIYLPNFRSWYEPNKKGLVSGPNDGLKTKLPSTVEDPIVVNNICCDEFDYTESPTITDEVNSNP